MCCVLCLMTHNQLVVQQEVTSDLWHAYGANDSVRQVCCCNGGVKLVSEKSHLLPVVFSPRDCLLHFILFLFFVFFQGLTRRILKFPGQGSNWSYSCQPTPQPQPQPHGIQAAPVTYTTAHRNAVLNPLSKARDPTCILMDTSWIHFCCVTTETPRDHFLERLSNWHASRRIIRMLRHF